MSNPAQTQIHGTCVALGEDGVLLRGPSGAGKSDLALRLIDRGARLVADDRVELRRCDGRLLARAPAPLNGLIEVRGLGIVRLPSAIDVAIALVVDLVPAAEIERLPEPEFETLLGVARPRLALDPFEVSAPAKIALALVAGVGVVAAGEAVSAT